MIVDGAINSTIVTIEDKRRLRARFLLRTGKDEDLAVEVRGVGVEKLRKEWRTGDLVQVRGRLGTGGTIAATTVRRTERYAGDPVQEQWPFLTAPAIFSATAA